MLLSLSAFAGTMIRRGQVLSRHVSMYNLTMVPVAPNGAHSAVELSGEATDVELPSVTSASTADPSRWRQYDEPRRSQNKLGCLFWHLQLRPQCPQVLLHASGCARHGVGTLWSNASIADLRASAWVS